MQNFLYKRIIEMRKKRKSGFLFLVNNLSLFKLAAIFSLEFLRQTDLADKLMISFVLKELVDKKIITQNGIKIDKYFLNPKIIYCDVNIRTTDNKIYSRGTNTDLATAFAKAIGEVLERTSTLYPFETEQVFSKNVFETKNKEEYLNFNIFAKPTEKQLDKFPEFSILENDIFEFVQGQNWFSGKNIFIPRQLIYFGEGKHQEKKIIQSTTHGSGFGYSENMATNSSFFEIVHRHFFLKSWYHKQSPNLLDILTVNNNFLQEKISALQKKGFKINILDYRQETGGLPTFICILEIFGGWYCGGSTSLDIDHAIERCIDEAFSIYLWEIKQIGKEKFVLTKKYTENVQPGFVDESLNGGSRVLLFANSHFLQQQDKFILAGEKSFYNQNINFEPKEFSLEEFVKKHFGEHVYFKRINNPMLDLFGVYTKKVYIPNSYYFALTEINSRPILLDGVQPIYTGTNPFP